MTLKEQVESAQNDVRNWPAYMKQWIQKSKSNPEQRITRAIMILTTMMGKYDGMCDITLKEVIEILDNGNVTE